MTPAQTLVAFFVDEARDHGAPENWINALKSPIAQRIGVLLRDGVPPGDIEMGLFEFIRRQPRSALALHDIIAEQAQPKRKTGWRFVRGSHSGTYKRDPQGTDRPPPGWPT